ncbi:MAG: hypothetical protein WCP77_09610, partial [Roseococcus sp.]
RWPCRSFHLHPTGSTTTSFLGNVGEAGAIGANQLVVRADASTTADSSLTSAAGGLVTVTSGNVNASSTPTLTVNFGGSSSRIHVAGDISVTASQATDADAKAQGASGGLVNVGALTSNAVATPSVSLVVGSADQIEAGGTITLMAQHGGTVAPSSDGTVQSFTGTNPGAGATLPGASNYVTFSLAHNLTTGAVVRADSGIGGGLTAGNSYGVVVRDDHSIYLGANFLGTRVNTATDTITFGYTPSGGSFTAMPHNLHTGDYVYYFDNGLTPVGGLASGHRYRVTVVSETEVKLLDDSINYTEVNIGRGAVSGSTISAANIFSNGDAVTYHLVDKVEFSASEVDVSYRSGSAVTTNNNQILIEGHGFAEGARVKYRSDGAPLGLANGRTLTNGGIYVVHRVDADNITLSTLGAPSTVLNLARSTSNTATHSLRLQVDEALPGLTDGGVYFIRDVTASSFKLASSLGGAALSFSLGTLTSGGHHIFAREGNNLTSAGGAGTHLLTLDLSAAGTGKFSGIGDISAASGATSGNQLITASTTGVGGGFIQIGSATATATETVTTNLTINAGAHLTAQHIATRTDSNLSVYGVSDGKGGGFVSLGDATARAFGYNYSTLQVANGAVLTAADDISIESFTGSDVQALAKVGNGGFITGSSSVSLADLQFTSTVLVAGRLTAGDVLTLGSRSSSNAEATSQSDTGAFAAGVSARADTGLGRIMLANGSGSGSEDNALTRTSVQNTAVLTAAEVVLNANAEKLRSVADASSDVGALGARVSAVANARDTSRTVISLAGGSSTTGTRSVLLNAQNSHVNSSSSANAELTALGGTTDATASSPQETRVKIEGMDGALLYTPDLSVYAQQIAPAATAHAHRDNGPFISGDRNDSATHNNVREIFWEATVVMLGEANPYLMVDEDGRIVAKVNVEVAGGYQLGELILTPEIVVTALDYDNVPRASFYANDLTDAPLAQIWGNAGSFEYKRTWDSVRLINYSAKNLRTNLIDVVAFGGTIDIAVDTIHGPTNNPANNVSLNKDNPSLPGPGRTFEFDLTQSFARTQVLITNLQPGGIANADIILDGRIENPIGSTTILNERGNILADADADVELIRTNTLSLEAQDGSIGRQASMLVPRNPIAVELVRFTDRNGTLRTMNATADATGDVVLDLTAFDRADAALGGNFSLTVPIQRITAGDDVDVVVNDSKEGNGGSGVANIIVSLFNPPVAAAYSVLPYRTHFRPDIANPGLLNLDRAFGTDAVEIDSTFSFAQVRAGDDIDIGHVTTTPGLGEARSYATTSIGGAPYGSSVVADMLPDTVVAFTINTDVAWGEGSTDDGVPQIFLTTNGNISATELAGDMLVGHVHSTGGDVTLRAALRILDADATPSIDVTGNDIALYSGIGSNKIPGTIGGIGKPRDFLEINTDRNGAGGVLTAYDIVGAVNQGIFIDEITGSMPVAEVWTKANVSLRTVGGSILDAEHDATADVLGQAVDIDANGKGATIGTLTDELEIDSSRSVSVLALDADGPDVALEASNGIFVTETSGAMRLLLAHAYAGDIRLTVRESAALGQDFLLVKQGTARFAESNSRDPGNQDDAERVVANGLVFAETGRISLFVGDNVSLHQASGIIAAGDVEIFGDNLNLDAGYGTTMTLRGVLVAGANLLVPGNQSGANPMGVALPSVATPTATLRIYGNGDADSISFGDTSGITGATGIGSDGYIYLGSRTEVYGGAGE